MKGTVVQNNTVETEDLYTTNDIKRVREILIKEQNNKDAITGLSLKDKRAVLDHWHDDEQFVRAVLAHETNSFIGVIENAHKRHIAYWLKDMSLEDLLLKCSAFLKQTKLKDDKRFRHTGWIKKVNTLFNKLSEPQKKTLLTNLGYSAGSNATERKRIFKDLIKERKYSFKDLKSMILLVNKIDKE